MMATEELSVETLSLEETRLNEADAAAKKQRRLLREKFLLKFPKRKSPEELDSLLVLEEDLFRVTISDSDRIRFELAAELRKLAEQHPQKDPKNDPIYSQYYDAYVGETGAPSSDT